MDIKLNIAVCEDDADFVDRLSEQAISIKKGCSYKFVKLYSGTGLLKPCRDNAVDIILTDIDMPAQLHFMLFRFLMSYLCYTVNMYF